MKTVFASAAIAAMLVLIAGCGAEDEPTGVIPEAQLKAMDKAENLEQLLQDSQQAKMQSSDAK